jgi:methyl-accepting chemotaxis protein
MSSSLTSTVRSHVRVTLNQKLWSLVVVVWMGLLMIAIAGIWQYRASTIADRKAQLVVIIDQATSVIDHYYRVSQQGAMTEEEAKKRAAEVLTAFRYGKNGYITVSDSRGIAIVQPMSPQQVGRDMSGLTDPAGHHVVLDMIRTGSQDGGGFVDYDVPKPGDDRPVPKMAFTRRFAPWDWIPVTGMYMDDVEDAIRVQAFRWVGVTVVLGLLITLAMTYVLRSVRLGLGGDLEEAIETTRRIAQGDLTSEAVSRTWNDRSLMNSVALMQRALAKAVRHVRDGANNISVGANEIAAGNLDLSQRTEEQAAALLQTVSSMEQMTTTVRLNADSARQASQLAGDAAGVATRGSEVVGEVAAAMNQITSNSQKIGDITSLIDGIAFQTNILALNAAVEAARAGDHGRGFAVVAAEVRSLAQRSATAAKEIKALISQSTTTIDSGAALVANAYSTMTGVVASVRRVSETLRAIDDASTEQSAGIEQVNRAIAEIDQVTQQNAALVQQAAAASQSLKDQAAVLREAISGFTLPAATNA